jgi:two-component system sensor histidine kinase UhpB
MVAADAVPAPPAAGARSLDLKWSLTLRVVAVAFACLLAAAALALYGTYRDLRQANEAVADVVARQLQLQLIRIDSSIDLPARFPDWDPVLDGALGPGQCVSYVASGGATVRSSCMGVERGGRSPAWLSSLGIGALAAEIDAARPVLHHGAADGTVVVATEPAVVLAAVWNDVTRLTGLTALLVGAICLLQHVAIGRALRPTKEILAGLDRLARGDLACRLPGFRLAELRRIGEVFNTLAARLDETTRERAALAARLVDAQEQERRRLARELHDELAQSLSAVAAAAASIRATAEAECPALVAEANGLAETAAAMMRSLRATLNGLRPPEIDDFGLAASLAALAGDQKRRSGGKLEVELSVDGDLAGLPPTAAAHVYRIVQEGLTNICKHAGASRARVCLGVAPPPARGPARRRWLALTIEDDGYGPDGCRPGAERGGLGLVGMRERAMALGGRLEVIRLERGFRLEAAIPFAAMAEAAE